MCLRHTLINESTDDYFLKKKGSFGPAGFGAFIRGYSSLLVSRDHMCIHVFRVVKKLVRCSRDCGKVENGDKSSMYAGFGGGRSVDIHARFLHHVHNRAHERLLLHMPSAVIPCNCPQST